MPDARLQADMGERGVPRLMTGELAEMWPQLARQLAGEAEGGEQDDGGPGKPGLQCGDIGQWGAKSAPDSLECPEH